MSSLRTLLRHLQRTLGDDGRELYDSYRERATLLLIKYLARVVSFLLVGVLWMVIGAVVVILLGVALGFLLGSLVGSNALGFLLSAVVWCAIGVAFYRFRHRLVVSPVVVKLRKIFFGK